MFHRWLIPKAIFSPEIRRRLKPPLSLEVQTDSHATFAPRAESGTPDQRKAFNIFSRASTQPFDKRKTDAQKLMML